MAQWLGFRAFTDMAQVQSLLGELRSSKLCSVAKKKKKNKFKWTLAVQTCDVRGSTVLERLKVNNLLFIFPLVHWVTLQFIYSYSVTKNYYSIKYLNTRGKPIS